MKVLFIPNYTEGNPYQRALAEHVSTDDVDVHLTSGYPLSTARDILRVRPDVIHVHWIGPFLVSEGRIASIAKASVFIAATLLAKTLGVSVVWTVHNILDHDRQNPRLELSFRQLYARLCHAIIVHCDAARQAVVSRYELDSDEKVFVVAHGNYADYYENTVDRTRARAELGVEDDETTFLHFGQIRPYKQVPHLIEEFSQLSDKNARLFIVGKPTEESEARGVKRASRSDSRITTEFAYVSDDELQVYLNAADAVVLPYRDVLTSGSAILAMTFDKPVIAPHIGCLPEFLDGENGQDELLYDPDDQRLADILRRSLRVDLEAIGARNGERAAALDWNEIGADTRAIYGRS